MAPVEAMTTSVRVRDCQGAPSPGEATAITLREVRVKPGMRLSRGHALAMLEWQEDSGDRKEARIKVREAGKVEKVMVKAKEAVTLE